MDDPKPQAKEYHEGPEAARRFEGLVRQAVSVSSVEIKKRHKEWEKTRTKRNRVKR